MSRVSLRRLARCGGTTTTRSSNWWPSGWRSRKGRITAKRLLPAARPAGYEGSARNLRRLVAARKALWRNDNHRGRRPAVWSPGEHLVIDWGVLGALHVFWAVRAWSRVRFVRFALDERRRAWRSRRALVQALAQLAGRVLPAVEVDSIIRRCDELTRAEANRIWTQHQRAPSTLPFRDYAAMTLKFWETAKARDRR